MERPKFVMEASEAESLAQQAGLTSVLQLLPTLVQPAQIQARPPLSNYYVGAVALGSSGRVFLGVNLEFPGLPLNYSVHAEQFLVTNLYLNSEPSFSHLAVSAPPCGHCRQFLQEIRSAPDMKVLITSISNEYDALSHFLPHRFGPDDLLDKHQPLLLEPRDNRLSFREERFDANVKNSITTNGEIKKKAEEEEEEEELSLKDMALEAANKSYAPYSGCPSGVALMDVEGKVYKGSYTESAAYNPSLGPVQAAIVAYVAEKGGGYERIVAALLVEKEEAMVKQEDAARLLLKAISPKCELKVFHCFSCSKN